MRFLSVGPGLACLFTLAILACDDGTTGCPICPLPPLTVTDFPMEVGTHWVYHVIDTMSGDEDTVDVQISAERLGPFGERVTTWDYSSRNGVFDFDSVFAYNNRDTVRFHRILDDRPYQTIMFPVCTGRVWYHLCECGTDSNIVINEESVRTPSRVFRAYRVERTATCYAPDVIDKSTLWLSKDVGLVRMIHTSGFRYPTSVTVWTLLE